MQVTVDDELDAALRRAAPHLRSSTQGARIRELALRGAEHVDDLDRAAYAAAVGQLLDKDLAGLDEVVARRDR